MIHDRLARADVYRSLSPLFARAIDYARNATTSHPLGRHAIEGDDLFAIAQTYTTKPFEQTRWEAHRRYIDLQLMLEGEERMDVVDLENAHPIDPFDAEKDVGFYTCKSPATPLVVRANEFAIFYPHDVHRPTIAVADPMPIWKLVLKIRCE
jgi:biofilm protein TabA